jgi:hypothetical protein
MSHSEQIIHDSICFPATDCSQGDRRRQCGEGKLHPRLGKRAKEPLISQHLDAQLCMPTYDTARPPLGVSMDPANTNSREPKRKHSGTNRPLGSTQIAHDSSSPCPCAAGPLRANPLSRSNPTRGWNATMPAGSKAIITHVGRRQVGTATSTT